MLANLNHYRPFKRGARDRLCNGRKNRIAKPGLTQ
jgi:hypothetical protein